MIQDADFQSVSDNAHAAGGACAVFGCTAVWGMPVTGFLLIMLFAGIKEFWYDFRYERPEISGGFAGSRRDFFGYLVGAVVALMIVLFKGVFA